MTAWGPSSPLIVVVAYQSDDHLGACLGELAERYPAVIVDNDASLITEAMAAKLGARYAATKENLGFAKAVNYALSIAWDGEADVLLLNPDARVAAVEVERLMQALYADEKLAAVGPRLFGEDGYPQAADWPIPSPRQVWADAFARSDRYEGPRFVTGAALLLKGAALAQLGGLDERYFLYAEEADWQLAAQRAGWKVAVATDVSVLHYGGASSRDMYRREALFHQSGALFARKWYGPFGAAIMRLGSIVAAARRAITGDLRSRRIARRALKLMVRPGGAAAELKR